MHVKCDVSKNFINNARYFTNQLLLKSVLAHKRSYFVVFDKDVKSNDIVWFFNRCSYNENWLKDQVEAEAFDTKEHKFIYKQLTGVLK